MRALAFAVFVVASWLVAGSSAVALSRVLRRNTKRTALAQTNRVDSMVGRVFHGKTNSYRVAELLSAPGDYDLFAAGRPAAFDPTGTTGFVGAGGNGRVYRATITASGRVVAAKFMTRASDAEFDFGQRIQTGPLSAICKQYFPVMIERFVLPEGVAGGYRYVHIMELLDGVSLDHAIEQGAFGDLRAGAANVDDVARITRVWGLLNDAINCLHSVGLIHSDLKPGNVMYRHDAVPAAATIKVIVCTTHHRSTSTGRSSLIADTTVVIGWLDAAADRILVEWFLLLRCERVADR